MNTADPAREKHHDTLELTESVSLTLRDVSIVAMIASNKALTTQSAV